MPSLPSSPLGDPKDTRNLFIAIVLSLAVILGWQYFVDGPRQAQIRAAQADQQAQAVLAAGNDPGQAPVLPDMPAAGTAGSTAPLPGRPRPDVLADNPRLQIETPSLHGSISLVGGRIDDLTLAGYRETVEPDSPEIILLSPAGTDSPYYAEFGWRAAPGVAVPDASTRWQADHDKLVPGRTVTLTWNNGQGLTFTRAITLDDHYLFTVTQGVKNDSGQAVELYPYGLVARNADPHYKSIYLQHEGPIGIYNGKLAEQDYREVSEQKIVRQDTTGGWFGFTDKHWLVALIPAQDQAVSARILNVPQVSERRFQIDFMAPSVSVAPGQSHSLTAHMFAGAKEVRLLDRYEDQIKVPHLDLAIDFGWFYFMTKPFFYALDYLAHWLGNFGLAILAFTVVLKLFLFPLANHSYVSMARMKTFMPKMQELRDTYKDDMPRQSQELMALYKREGINPLSGCWPVLIQIPIFFSLYKVLYVSIEMRHAPFYGWIRDLSVADPSNVFTLFGFIPWDTPAGLHVGFFPLLMGLTMWLQMKMNPPPTDPTQKMIFALMPVFFTISLSHFAVGLVIYWTWSNILSIAQQYLIMHRMKVRVF